MENLGLNSILTKVLAGVLLFTYFAVSYGFHLYGVKIPNCVYRNFLLECIYIQYTLKSMSTTAQIKTRDGR